MTTYRLTQSELIARIYARAAAYDSTDFYLRDLLMIDFTFPNDYAPTNSPFLYLIAECDAIFASADIDHQNSPNLFNAMNDSMRRTMHECLAMLMQLNRQSISEMRLNASLCPLHAHDYAICFDDASCLDDDESPDDSPFAYTRDCAAIRLCFPSHDT